jgi:2',3'-cyclic-nucleotide 2'-phosphodiesterase (5'-nucleotidase family)
MHRHQTLKIWILTFIFLGSMGDALSFSAPPSRELVIVYSGNTLGELKPCGCDKEEDQGGFERRLTYLKEVFANSKNILLVDTGDNFKEPSTQGKIKARYIMQAISKLKYDAVIPGDKDLVYGEPFLNDDASVPWLLSNAELTKIKPPKIRIKKLENGLTVAMLALIDPDLYYDAKHSGGSIKDPIESAKKLIKKLKISEHPDVIVLLTHMKRGKAISMLDLSGVDVVINGHIGKDTDIIDMTHIKRNGKIFAQSGPRGQKMGELTIRIDSKGEKSFKQRVIPLDSNIKPDTKMIEWYNDYNKEVEDLFFISLESRKADSGKQKVYASEQACVTCHSTEHKAWVMSRHSHAYETLNRVNKAFDPECLSCHVTGWGENGGFISEVDTPKLKNVQCEVCHSPRLDHIKNLERNLEVDAKIGRASCRERVFVHV